MSVFNALLLYLLYHRAALSLHQFALHLHWIGHHHYPLNEKITTLEINKRATASTNHIYSFLLLQMPRPFPLHYQFRPPCHSHDGTAGLIVCVCVSARLYKLMYDRCMSLFTALKLPTNISYCPPFYYL